MNNFLLKNNCIKMQGSDPVRPVLWKGIKNERKYNKSKQPNKGIWKR